jgi:uncharacterized protein YggE
MTPPIVTVRGEAQLEVPPDRATLSVSVQASGDTAEQVRAQLAESSVSITELQAGFADAVVESSTTGLHVAPTFNRRTPTKITGYAGTFTTQIVVADFEVLSPLVLALTELSAVQVDGPWWWLSHDHPARRQARIAAITDARVRAADYAAAFDAEVGALVEVSDLEPGGFGGARPQLAMRMSKSLEQPEFDFAPAGQTVSGQVTVQFELDRALAVEPVGRVSEQ